jgi:hypothetical protein
MAQPFDVTNPPNSQALKLGALRIREMKTILNNTLGLLYTLSASDSTSASVSEVANSVSGTMLKQHASDDSARAIATNHIKDGAVTVAKIGDNAVTSAKLQSSASDNSQRAVGNDHIQNTSVNLAKLAQSSANSGDTVKWNGSNWVKFTPDVDVISGATISTTGVTSGSTLSASAATVHTLAHNLGALPKLVRAVLVKTGGTTEAGYAVGDEIDIHSAFYNNGTYQAPNTTVGADATNVVISNAGFSGGNMRIIHKTTGAATVVTAANWTPKAYAWK